MLAHNGSFSDLVCLVFLPSLGKFQELKAVRAARAVRKMRAASAIRVIMVSRAIRVTRVTSAMRVVREARNKIKAKKKKDNSANENARLTLVNQSRLCIICCRFTIS